MALPSSGTITMNGIRTELAIPTQAPFSLNTAVQEGYVYLNDCSAAQPNPAPPQTLSEWYSYNHSAPCYNQGNFKFSGVSCTDACAGPFNTVLYSCCSPLTNGCVLRETLVIPGNYCGGPVPNVIGWYSNGTTCYEVTDGTIIAITSCATTTTTAPPTTTTTTVAAVCHNFIATATGVMVWTDCCGVNQNQFLIAGDTFCAQVGTVFGSWLDQGTNCNC